MKKAFVIGHPIAHSRSPLIHRTWIAEHGLDASYEAIDVAPADLAAFIGRLREGEFAGGNVTIPHKEEVMGLVDALDPLAKRIGAVNTLVAQKGKILGTNTDYEGFLANLDAQAPGWDAALESAVVIGAGGAARAILAGLTDRGVPRIDLVNRTLGRAQALAAEFGPTIAPGPLSRMTARFQGAGLVVNTSSVGMKGTAFTDLDLSGLAPGAVVADIVYTPLITPLLAQARAKGFACVDGLGMLLHQAVPGFRAWFGVAPAVTETLTNRVLAALGQ
ncbi:shikimate dehydrogenase [Pelagibacterium halotolerans]|uniref:Shikimate dehydrogenase (NADP(+)) n=1 Tax=Pelagibacterium halotolerans (strain DSM 22347 / JCM 15775 / CGMCC 1.7692 / B2) TaxID=1082931 RepID=G4R7R0_PELHB|nr:shikimate dehydrogenase [Pelagibacterium halotolerans]AEQ53320.1 Shikimate 5-dehydrogenase I alpha [Pelagibacterium halotolerans B2]QJR17066.1 shikimate dehydrogenase [Pelagibacterium halotolerans]SEA63081.1 shikimate dehydrogenase [Pelagibacterium halotolerans]